VMLGALLIIVSVSLVIRTETPARRRRERLVEEVAAGAADAAPVASDLDDSPAD